MAVDNTAIVLVNWNGWRDTVDCVKHLLALQDRNFSVLVCDNASTDDSIAQIKSWAAGHLDAINSERVALGKSHFGFVDRSHISYQADRAIEVISLDQLVLVQTGRNGGYAAGNNVGLQIASASGFQYFWVLNNDTEVHQDALHWLKARMNADATIGMCGSTLIYHGDRSKIQARGGARFDAWKGRSLPLGGHSHTDELVDATAVEASLDMVIGASMFVSKAFLDQIGLMEERYFLYWEEIDWATRGAKKFKLGYAEKSIVYHKVGASIGTNDFGDLSPLADYYIARGQVKYCLRYSKISMPFVVFDILRNIFRWLRRTEPARALSLLRALVGLSYQRPSH